MEDNKIKAKFEYNSQKIEIICKPDDKIKEIFQKAAEQNELDFEKIYFLLNGQKLLNEEYDKPLSQFVSSHNSNTLSFLIEIIPGKTEVVKKPKIPDKKINDIPNTSPIINTIREPIKEFHVIFIYQSNSNDFKCSLKDKMSEIFRGFGNTIELDFNLLNFFYNNELLDPSQTFEEIISENDKNEGKIEIKVEKKQNNEIEEKDGVQKNEESFFQKNKKKILIIGIIIGIILVVILIVVSVVVLKKKKKDNKEEKKDQGQIQNQQESLTTIINDNEFLDKCLLYDDSSISKECLMCRDEYDLYNGECIQYAFVASYNTNNSYNLIQIFNPDKINELYAIKIDNYVINPNYEVIFYNNKNNKIYFYLNESKNISLANMFENNTALIDFSFNEKCII